MVRRVQLPESGETHERQANDFVHILLFFLLKRIRISEIPLIIMQQQKDEDYYYKAYHQLRFRKYDQCIDLCTEYLSQKPLDQVNYYINRMICSL